MNAHMIRKQNRPIAYTDSRSNQPHHFLKLKPNPEQSPNSSTPQRLREVTAERLMLQSWCMIFEGRTGLCNTDVRGEAASAEGEAAVSQPEDPAEIVSEGGFFKQILSVYKTAFYWKKMQTFVAREKSMFGFKSPKVSLTV